MFQREDNTERYFADAHGADDDALTAGFAWMLRFAEDNGHRQAAVMVPSLQQVESLGRVLGDQAARSLEKNRKLQLDGVTAELFTQRGLPFAYEQGPVLAVWVDDKQLDKLDGLRAPALCAIPWNRTDIDGWKRSWNPTDIRTGESSGSAETVANPVVVAALQSLTDTVNLGTGLGHPSDKASAVQMFKALKEAGEGFDPEQVRAWAVRHGWEARHARELGELAAKVNAGRTVRGGEQKMWRDNIVELWREDAAGK